MVSHAKQTVLDNRRLSKNTFVLRTSRPDEEIKAGQCFSVGTSELAINREYSMYSAATDPFVDFLIREVDGGAVSSALARLDSGQEVEVGGPYGSFCLNDEQIHQRRYVFIASGTGIAPFASYVKTFPGLDYTLLHGVRFEEEQYDFRSYPENRYVPCISRPNSGRSQRVTDVLSEMELHREDLYYLCGNRSMITDCVQILRDRRIPGGNVFMETFF